MNLAIASSPEFEKVFALNDAGLAELSCGITSLSRPAVELLLRLDGQQSLRTVREAMGRLPDPEFARAFGALRRRELLREDAGDLYALHAAARARPLGLAPERAQPRQVTRLQVGLACAAPVRPRPAGQELSAVVVEDDPVLLRFLQHFLAMGGFEVRTASNRAEVLDVIRQGAPDLFILDGSLPDVDGFDVLRSIRKHRSLAAVPVIMMTGRSRRQDVLEAFAHGAHGYLTKPVDAGSLLESARAVLGLPAEEEAPGTTPWLNRDAVAHRRGVTA